MTPRHRRLFGIIVGVAFIAPLTSGPSVSAAPVDDKRREAARIEAELEEQGRQLSVRAERYNQASLRLNGVQQKLATAQADLARAEERMTAARATVADAAVVAYVHGGSNAMLGRMVGSADNDTLVARRQYLRVAVSDQRRVIGQLQAAREDLADLRGRLESDEASAREAAEDADAARREAAEAEAAEREVLGRVKGELAGLVAAESARRDEERARQAAAAAPAPPPRPGPAPAAAPKGGGPVQAAAAPVSAPPASSGAAAAVAEAQRQLGKPYKWGGAGPDNFDCSGLMQWSWKAAGVRLSHSAASQYHETTRVPTNALQPGDLLFFGPSVGGIHHNGMYVGNGQMIHASQTGTPVKYSNAFRKDLVGAGRPG